MKKITIHTDGGCEGNPGPGGWAAVLAYGGQTKEISGGEIATTNNRMELQASIAALEALTEPCEVDLFTDSTYLRDGITKWIKAWKARGWLTLTKQPVKNEDLWRALDAAAGRHRVHWRWLKGHAGHAGNERCHVLAAVEIEGIKRRFSCEQLRAALSAWQCERAPGPGQGELFQ